MRVPEAAQWKAASNKEIKKKSLLKTNNVYTLVPHSAISPGIKPVRSRCVYKIKAHRKFRGTFATPVDSPLKRLSGL